MVRFVNKDLKAHGHLGEEKLSNFMDRDTQYSFIQLLKFHLRNFGQKSPFNLTHLLQKTTIHIDITAPGDLNRWMEYNPSTKKVFLLLELILEQYKETNKMIPFKEYSVDFVNDINEFFIIHGVQLQIRFFPDTFEFYVEKIISEEVSQKIKEVFENFSKEEKVFQDFKKAIKKFSLGDYENSIESCCVTLEDYFCIILRKNSCPSVESYYKEISKKLKIPGDLDNRFSNIISYIHKHRSVPKHGSIIKKEFEDLELINEVIIQFTIIILIYLKKKYENTK